MLVFHHISSFAMMMFIVQQPLTNQLSVAINAYYNVFFLCDIKHLYTNQIQLIPFALFYTQKLHLTYTIVEQFATTNSLIIIISWLLDFDNKLIINHLKPLFTELNQTWLALLLRIEGKHTDIVRSELRLGYKGFVVNHATNQAMEAPYFT